MPYAQALLPEFDQEMATTRRMLERVPLDRADWTPHPKSTPLGRLASHLAAIPSYGRMALESEEVDVNPPGGEPRRPPQFTKVDEMLAAFDRNVQLTRQALETVSEAELTKTFTLKNAGHTILSLPRKATLRVLMMNHLIHHRAQLGVYLRLNDVPLPRTYGPSADEPIG